MRDIGVRLARQKLLRYRMPEPQGRRWRRWLLLGAALWAVWALFVSDHSVARLLRLKSQRDHLAVELDRSKADLEQAKTDLLPKRLTPEEAERIFRERHGYAREGEIVYIWEDDSTGKPARPLSPPAADR